MIEMFSAMLHPRTGKARRKARLWVCLTAGLRCGRALTENY